MTRAAIDYDWGREDALVGVHPTSRDLAYRWGYIDGLSMRLRRAVKLTDEPKETES